jgi:hypothetical protein
MLLPKNMPKKVAVIVYSSVCALHGFSFGILYAPTQALIYHLNFEQAIAWIITGIGFDITHGISNIFTGLLVEPFSELFRMLLKRRR